MNSVGEILKKILFSLGFELTINWRSRYRAMGAESVYDSETVKRGRQNDVTREQIARLEAILASVI